MPLFRRQPKTEPAPKDAFTVDYMNEMVAKLQKDTDDKCALDDAMHEQVMRDGFARAALQGMLAGGADRAHADALARSAYALADAMLAEREKASTCT